VSGSGSGLFSLVDFGSSSVEPSDSTNIELVTVFTYMGHSIIPDFWYIIVEATYVQSCCSYS